MSKLDDFIKQGWIGARSVAGEKDLPLPYPFVPPCGEGPFKRLYYWDTYFTNIGLIMDGHADWARENVDNLLFALDYFGCVPNFTRKDGAIFCSQPPLLGIMIKDVYNASKDEKWLYKSIVGLEKEYDFWMTRRMTQIGLNQYGTNAFDKGHLTYYYGLMAKRIGLDLNATDEEKIKVAQNLIAEAESGEDFTPRYNNHNATEYVQIDLNSHLWGVENLLAEFYKDKDEDKSAYYSRKRDNRLVLIERYCYNAETGIYADYNFVTKKTNSIICGASFMPYFYGFARQGENLRTIYDKLKSKGGVVSCEDTGDRVYQWGYPYIWAPHQYFAYMALKNYGENERADELCRNYTELLSNTYDKTEFLWERYTEDGNAPDLEYPTQKMLGWTAGVYRYLQSMKG
ncbi:MAG: hypothetical protein IKA61_05405 [Clostridia bacterium]|nr:hypothetical protein [Clostridia bacterium]